jgi:DUF1680 family protein
VNGKRNAAQPGTFARIQREWKSGDRIDLELPMKPRLEPFNAEHRDIVAILVGPQVMFRDQTPNLTSAQLLSATKAASGEWHVATGQEPLKMVPWTAIQDQPYSTYLRVG